MFISFLIGYVVLGLTLSAPIGPVNAAQLDKGVRGGFMPAWFIGLGAAAAAIIYIDRLSRGHSSAGASICAGVFMDVRQFCIAVYRGRRIVKSGSLVSEPIRSGSSELSRSFLQGFLMSLFNPLSIMFWLGIYGSVLARTVHTSTMDQLLLYSAAIIFGVLLWDLFMAAAVSFFRKYLTPSLLKGFAIISGLSLVAFGCYFGFKAFQFLFFT